MSFILIFPEWISFLVVINGRMKSQKSTEKNIGLPISFALSANKTVSKIGIRESKPTGRLEVKQPDIQPFLNPLSIKKIPMVGDVTFQLLSRLDISYQNIYKDNWFLSSTSISSSMTSNI